MKNTPYPVWLFAVLMTCHLAVFAQSTPRTSGTVSLGAKAGLGLSSIIEIGRYTNFATVPPHIGSLGGISVWIPIRPRVIWVSELLVQQNGARMVKHRRHLSLTYLQVPMQITVPIGDTAKRLTGFVSTGIYGGVFLVGAIKGTGEQQPSTAVYNLSRFDFGLVFGGGIALRTGKGQLTLEPRISYGILDINKDDHYQMKNLSVSFSIGYLHPLNKKH